MTSPGTTNSPVIFGRYQVHEALGETRLAVVYKATDLRLQRPVFVHLLRKSLLGNDQKRQQFLAEAAQSARRSHPVFLEVFDSGESNGRPFLITEAAEGRPLYGIGALSVTQALSIVHQVVDAIALCQRQRSPELPLGLYHPPISSANLLLVGDNQVKLVESWHLSPALVPADLAYYRAPELSTGQAAQPASVVYALGILLFELITGQRPIRGEDAKTTALAHLTQSVPSLARIRPTMYVPSLDDLIAQATAREPGQRFADAQVFGTAINNLWHQLTVPTRRLSVNRPEVAQVALPAPERTATPRGSTNPVRTPAPSRSQNLRDRFSQAITAAFDIDQFRRQDRRRSLTGWLIMILLLLTVALGSYWAVTWAFDRLNLSAPRLPELPAWQWPDLNLTGQDTPELYVVNINEGLNLRSAPNTRPETIVMVVPNGTVVRKLAGPVMADNIPWLKVRFELNGQVIEGWMSMNYLRPQQ